MDNSEWLYRSGECSGQNGNYLMANHVNYIINSHRGDIHVLSLMLGHN